MTTYSITGIIAGQSVSRPIADGELRIGRSLDCGLTVLDEEASRLHCIVRASGDRITVEDLSQNGTSVNGTKITSVTELKAGDVLTIGTTRLTLQKGGAAAPVSAPTVTSASASDGNAPAFQPGDLVDRYRIKRLIGQGGMGTVYEVVHTGLDLPRALKALTLPDDPAYAAFRDKFLDEGKMLARLRHDNITQVHDAAYDEKTRTLFFVMDLVLYDDGRPCTLADVSYDECDVSAWFASLASALDYIHAQGIVHSDIKLQNVLVSPGQKIKLADFGVAHLLSGKMRSSLRGDATAESEKTIGFTEHYVAPEILKGNVLPSVASDVYALGVLLVRLLANKWYDEHPSVLAEIAAKRAMNWRPVLAQMLAADPARRPKNLRQLVTQLQKGTKVPVRRKYVLENRRRRQQKIRLVRTPNGKTNGLRSTPFAPESPRRRVVRWAAAAAACLVVAGGLAGMIRSNARARSAEEARLRTLKEVRTAAVAELQRARDSFASRVAASCGECGWALPDSDFADALSYVNVTGCTDRVRTDLRNEVLVRYGDVLKTAEGIRAATNGFRAACNRSEGRISACAQADAVRTALEEFDRKRRAAVEGFEAACERQRQAKNDYEEAKARIEKEREARLQFRDGRRRKLDALRQVLASEAALTVSPERTAATAKFAEGDRFATATPADRVAAMACYAEAVACLSNACGRLRGERNERQEIEESFQRTDEAFRTVQLAEFRRGQISLAVMARHAKEISDRFSARWNAECQFPSNRVLVENRAFVLQAPAVYFDYLMKSLPGRRDRLTLTPTQNGIAVDNGRFAYPLGWPEIFSDRKLGTKSEEKYRQLILGVCDVPADLQVSARLLLGRWIVLAKLMPALNTEDQRTRLVEAIRKDGGAATLACAQRELPDDFPVEDSADPSADEEEDEDSADEEIAPELPAPAGDPFAERVIFFSPAQGLEVTAFGRDSVKIVWCARVKDSDRVRFQIGDGVVFSNGAGENQTVADVAEGESFDAGNSTSPSRCRYWLVAWLDKAGIGRKPLVIIRCQRLRDE